MQQCTQKYKYELLPPKMCMVGGTKSGGGRSGLLQMPGTEPHVKQLKQKGGLVAHLMGSPAGQKLCSGVPWAVSVHGSLLHTGALPAAANSQHPRGAGTVKRALLFCSILTSISGKSQTGPVGVTCPPLNQPLWPRAPYALIGLPVS